MTRLIDADALCEEFKERQRAALRWKEKAILDDDEEIIIRADATLAFLSEVKLTIDNAPTVSGQTEIDNKVLQSLCDTCKKYYECSRSSKISPNFYVTKCCIREADNDR